MNLKSYNSFQIQPKFYSIESNVNSILFNKHIIVVVTHVEDEMVPLAGCSTYNEKLRISSIATPSPIIFNEQSSHQSVWIRKNS